MAFINWGQAARQVADKVNPFDGTDTDYNVFGNREVSGGARDPGYRDTGQLNPGWVEGANGGANYVGNNVQGSNTNNNTNTNTNTGGGSGTNAAAQQAARQAAAQQAALRGGFATEQTGYQQGARQSLTDVGNTYDQKTRDWLNSLEDGQGNINTRGSQNALNLRQSMANIVRGIQTGVKSGNVALAGMNALSSGAADAIARAYAQIGNQQTGEAQGQAATEWDQISQEQQKLNRTRREGESDLNTYRDTETGRVRGDFSNKLDTLKANASRSGINDVVNTGLVDQVLSEAMGRLAQIDQSRNQRLSGIQAWTPEQIMQEAIRMETAGQVGDAFSVTDPNVSYGGGQPGISANQVPIYLRNRDELSTLPMARGREQ